MVKGDWPPDQVVILILWDSVGLEQDRKIPPGDSRPRRAAEVDPREETMSTQQI